MALIHDINNAPRYFISKIGCIFQNDVAVYVNLIGNVCGSVSLNAGYGEIDLIFKNV